MSWSCTRPSEPGRCAAGVHLVLLAPTCQRCASRRSSSAKDHAPTHAAPGRRRSDPEIRVASAVAARGRSGNLTALNPHLLFLLRGRRLRRDSPTQAPDEVPSKCHAHGCWLYLLKGKGNLGADCIGMVAFPHGYCVGSSSDSSSNGLPSHFIRRRCRRRQRCRPDGRSAGLRSCGRAGATPTSAGLQRSPRAPKAPREVIRRHAGGVRKKQDRGHALSGDAPDGRAAGW
jgi:hypothetical protein